MALLFGLTHSRSLPLLYRSFSPFLCTNFVSSSSSLHGTTGSSCANSNATNQTTRSMNHSAKEASLPAQMSNSSTTPGNNKEKEDRFKTQLRFLGDKKLMEKQPCVTKDFMESESFQEKLQILQHAMKEHGGIGIAAPQIGLWNRIFCFGIEDNNPRYPAAKSIPLTFWINPEITWESEETNYMWEGCLSVPGMRGWVERPKEVILSGIDEYGVQRQQHLVGLEARIAQHELDHLDGILFPMRVKDAKFLVPQASMGVREGWGGDWPSSGSRKTGLGELCDEE